MAQPAANIFTDEANVIDMSKTPAIKGKQYLHDTKLAKVVNDAISEFDIELGNGNVEAVLVYPNISKKTGAKTIIPSPLLVHYSGADFFIQISGELWDMLDADTRKILVYHQLLHCLATYKEKDREWKYSIRKHDYADFYEINEKYGTDWYKTIQATVSSLYDLDPRKENEVSV